jgi:hypothetical protein
MQGQRRTLSALAVAGMLLAGCTTERRASTIGSPPKPKVDSAKDFQAAYRSFPIWNVTDYAKPDLGRLRTQADFLVVARLEGAKASQRRFAGYPSVTVEVTLAPEHVRRLRGERAEPARPFVLTLVVGEPFQSKDEAAAFVRAASKDVRVVLFAVRTAEGLWQLAHPMAWAVVNQDDSLTSLDIGLEPIKGLGGATTLAELTG